MYERRPVVGYEGLYEVSNEGEVFRVARGPHTSIGKKLKLTKKRNGYLQVGLRKNGIQTIHLVHRLVAEAFNPNPDNLPQVNHLNGIKTDNRDINLEWCNLSRNLLHAYQELGRKPSGGLPERPVIGTHILSGVKIWMPSMIKAAKFIKASVGAVSNVCKGKATHAKGWRFEYLGE
jgi:hypothetical protein